MRKHIPDQAVDTFSYNSQLLLYFLSQIAAFNLNFRKVNKREATCI